MGQSLGVEIAAQDPQQLKTGGEFLPSLKHTTSVGFAFVSNSVASDLFSNLSVFKRL